MSDSIEMFQAMDQVRAEERAARAALAPRIVDHMRGQGRTVRQLSDDGPHLRIDGVVDFWPSTGRVRRCISRESAAVKAARVAIEVALKAVDKGSTFR